MFYCSSASAAIGRTCSFLSSLLLITQIFLPLTASQKMQKKKKKPAQLKLAQNQMLSSTATDLKERYMISKSSLPWLSPKSLSLTDSHITIHHI